MGGWSPPPWGRGRGWVTGGGINYLIVNPLSLGSLLLGGRGGGWRGRGGGWRGRDEVGVTNIPTVIIQITIPGIVNPIYDDTDYNWN